MKLTTFVRETLRLLQSNRVTILRFLTVENKADQLAILREAAVVKSEGRSLTLSRQGEGEDVARDKVVVSLMADLQQLQDKETANYVDDMQDMVRNAIMSTFGSLQIFIVKLQFNYEVSVYCFSK